MYRLYYITLCDAYFGCYVTVWAKKADEAFELAVKKYGVLNVSHVYTEKAWKGKYTTIFTYQGEIENKDRFDYLRKKKII